ncbi:hypothetical protein GCM10011376_17900 [Nocardioides flavus (ex Wang et al. 2016)]|uniref:AAA domain-containing protein n=1 Tax=Nocardioides flavus (ex Wang et al. 2016) TaxID=2058780 RepID=A0ABQ3HHQ1_9ACTN|nr:AAA family ATPase [Nocardioides flavus (ex Wang et al. 2016)]GHE17180.1 hypothetical protein GCM10011376_17900 [Nocardioides flavus (ex Wang et al. 2016)]
MVVSGLPASGKTTVGTLLSQRLSLPLIDKDAVLEALFDNLGCPDTQERARLSRASDEVLYVLAATSSAAILVNWWDHASAPARLRDIGLPVVEVFCACPTETAASRFVSRSRHPGHHDDTRSPREVHESFRRLPARARGPMGLGYVIRVDTTSAVDADWLAAQVRAALDAVAPHS